MPNMQDLSKYLEATATVVNISGFDWKIRKLTIKEHREFRDSTPGDGGTDEDWISYHSRLIAAAVIEPKVDAETVANIISLGDLAELGKKILENSNPKKT